MYYVKFDFHVNIELLAYTAIFIGSKVEKQYHSLKTIVNIDSSLPFRLCVGS